VPPNTFDAAYIRRLKERDPETCQHFSAHFTMLLDHVLRGSVRNREIAADLRNETLYRVLRHVDRDQIREPERFGAFVRRVAKVVTLEYYRRNHKPEVQIDGELDPPDAQGSIDAMIAERQLRKLVHDAVEELAERDRRVIIEVCVLGRDRNDVARELGVNLAVLRVKLHRALNRLKDRLSPVAHPPPLSRAPETPRPANDTSSTEARK
jgi:RNA polymerase sigma factor (sigma-70 family)